MIPRGRPLLALALFMVAGCDPARRALEDAKRLHAEGKDEAAVAALNSIPKDRPEAVEAADTGASWNVEDSDRGTDPSKRRYSLEAALHWSPTYGPAVARYCLLVAELGDRTAATECITTKLGTARSAPEDIVGKAKAKLKELDEADERARLLASANSSDWQALVSKYPQSDEAKRAKDQIEKASSICRAYAWYDFTEFLTEMKNYPMRAFAVYEQFEKGNPLGAGSLGEKLATDIRQQRAAVKTRCAEIRGHATKPGEEKARARIVPNCDLLEAHYTKWEEALQKIEDMSGVERYALPLQREGTRITERVLADPKMRKLCDDAAADAARVPLFTTIEGRGPAELQLDPPTKERLLKAAFPAYLTERKQCKDAPSAEVARRMGQFVPTIAHAYAGRFAQADKDVQLAIISMGECSPEAATTQVVILDGDTVALNEPTKEDVLLGKGDVDGDGADEVVLGKMTWLGHGEIETAARLVSFAAGKRRVLRDFGMVGNSPCGGVMVRQSDETTGYYVPGAGASKVRLVRSKVPCATSP